MSRWIKTVVASSLMIMGSEPLWSWGQPRMGAEANSRSLVEPSFPLNEHQDWYVRESYLLWSPHEDDVDWANRFSTISSSNIDLKVRMKKPDFGWYSGARLAIGRYLPNHDYWDASLISTYFYAENKNHASPHRESGGTLISTWSPVSQAINYDEGKSTWRLNFFTWDLALGRNLFLSSKITAHPFFSLRTFLIYEKQAARYRGQQGIFNLPTMVSAKFEGYNNSWGIGPRLGSEFTYYLNKFWTLMGSFSGSVLLGSYQVGERVKTRTVNVSDPTNNDNHAFHISDHGFAIRPNLEGSIGMGWEKWVKRNRVRIAPSIIFEASQWFDMNQWIVLRSPRVPAPTSLQYYSTSRRHGDLTFLGFTFNLQTDF
jgi:hypothetical protein